MDRTTKAAWMGKSSVDSATAVSRKGNDIKYTLNLNEEDKSQQKLRLRYVTIVNIVAMIVKFLIIFN